MKQEKQAKHLVHTVKEQEEVVEEEGTRSGGSVWATGRLCSAAPALSSDMAVSCVWCPCPATCVPCRVLWCVCHVCLWCVPVVRADVCLLVLGNVGCASRVEFEVCRGVCPVMSISICKYIQLGGAVGAWTWGPALLRARKGPARA